MDQDEQARLAAALSAAICPLMAGHPPEVQGAVLMDLTAIWLSGHFIPGDAEATRALRAEMLAAHLLSLDEMVEHYDPMRR